MNKVKTMLCVLVISLLMSVSEDALSDERENIRGITSAHNDLRAALNLPDLIWSDKLAAVAQEWATHLANNKGCKMQHRPRHGENSRPFGENIYWASPLNWSDGRKEIQEVAPTTVVQSWASEVEDYDYNSNSCRKEKVCGHYTQVVWRNTTKLGCGMAICSNKSQIWVCNYDPPGNRIGYKPY